MNGYNAILCGEEAFFMVPVALQKGSGGRSKGFAEILALLEQETSQGRTLGAAKLITNYQEGNPHQKKIHVSFQNSRWYACMACAGVRVCAHVYFCAEGEASAWLSR